MFFFIVKITLLINSEHLVLIKNMIFAIIKMYLLLKIWVQVVYEHEKTRLQYAVLRAEDLSIFSQWEMFWADSKDQYQVESRHILIDDRRKKSWWRSDPHVKVLCCVCSPQPAAAVVFLS